MNSCRYSVHRCVSSAVFETIILLAVLASAVVLVLTVEHRDLKEVWDVILVCFVVVFLIELIFKLIALGCWGTREVRRTCGGELGGGKWVPCVCELV